jgi:sulfonate transport system substrate-binding protein
MTNHRMLFGAFSAALLITTSAGSTRADAPSAIRIGFPGVGVGNRPVSGASVLATIHLQGRMEHEFKKDGIDIEWSFLRGAGPAMNELYANGLVDFSTLGDLPSIVGQAAGLKRRVLASSSVGGNQYVAVPADSRAENVKDLRGKRIAFQKGTAGQLTANKILALHGLTEKDVRAINMDSATAKAALITKDVDAAFGSADYLNLRDQGVVRIIFSTQGQPPETTSNTLFIGSEDFITKYPQHTQRVVNVFVQTAKWIADQDANPSPVLKLWTKSGNTFSAYKEDWKGARLKEKLSPVVDAYLISRLNKQVELAKKFGLVKTTFDFETWVDRSWYQRALKQYGLENFWPSRNADGSYPAQHAAAAPAPAAPVAQTAQAAAPAPASGDVAVVR